MEYIIGSFAITGIYPFNRRTIKLPEDDKVFEVFKPCSLAEKTNLAYIPLYSPARSPHPAVISSNNYSTVSNHQYTPKKNGCSSASFASPLSYSSPLTSMCSRSEPCLLDESIFESQPLPCSSTISKFLVKPDPPSKFPTKRGKSAGRVLTSQENLHQMQEGEKEKQATALMKEERRKLREIRKSEKGKQKIKSCKYH